MQVFDHKLKCVRNKTVEVVVALDENPGKTKIIVFNLERDINICTKFDADLSIC